MFWPGVDTLTISVKYRFIDGGEDNTFEEALVNLVMVFHLHTGTDII